MIKNKLSLALLCTAVLFIGSCADENITDNNHGNKGGMSFEVSDVQDAPEDNPQSRSIAAAEPIGSIPFNESIAADACLQETTIDGVNPVKRTPETRAFLKSTIDADFGVSASKNGSNQADYFYNEHVSNTGVMVNPKVWSSDASSLKFYAIYPYMDGSNPNQKLVQASANALPTVDFTASTDIANQTDLMSAVTNEITYTPSSGGAAHVVPLKFRHALTAIRFGVGSNLSWGKTIKSVEFQNIHNKGNYNPATHTWTTGSTTANFKLDNINVLTNGTLNNVILKDGNTFLMVPQTLPSGAKIVITFDDGTSITAKIEGGKWKPGTTKTYMMTEKNSNWEYIIQAYGSGAIPYTQTTSYYGISSYRQVGTEQQPVAWKVIGFDSNNDNVFSMDEKPDWVSDLLLKNGSGGTSQEWGYARIKAADIVDLLAKRNEELKKNPKGNSSDYYDLSTHDIKGVTTSRNTANCYVISHPGFYKIPLVYGNAITGGNSNIDSYTSSAPITIVDGNDIVLHYFKDHNSQNITDPWIEKTNGGTNNGVDGGKLIWADEVNLVHNISISHDAIGDGFLQFEVKADDIKNGNAVIAATKGGIVVWSWHLWFAPDNVLDIIPVTNRTGYTYNFTTDILGWKYISWSGSSFNQPRSVKVKVQQTIPNGGNYKEATFTITQNPGSVKQGAPTFYQWGRKEAFPGTTSIAEGSFEHNADGTNMSIKSSIQNPDKFYLSSLNWAKTSNDGNVGFGYYNLWSVKNNIHQVYNTGNDNLVVKTIYDPSPSGFKLPPNNAFTRFTTTGLNSTKLEEINVKGYKNLDNFKSNFGWNFWTNESQDAIINFPPLGYRRDNDGLLSLVGDYGMYWSAVPNSTGAANLLAFNSISVTPLHWGPRMYGCCIRPIQDQ